MFCVRSTGVLNPYLPTARVGTVLSSPLQVNESIAKRWATKKTGGSTKNGRDSNPKYLGVKKFGGEVVKPGTWIIRQRGKQYHPGDNVTLGKDYTISAATIGRVQFEEKEVSIRKYFTTPNERQMVKRKFVSVVPFSFETKPSEREIIRVGLKPEEIQNQINETEKAILVKWTDEVYASLEKAGNTETTKERKQKAKAIIDKNTAAKQERFQKQLAELRASNQA